MAPNKINKWLHDAEVVIAFPQRDVHLNTLNPLEVRLVKPDSADPSAP